MTYIPAPLRRLVIERARGRCEYCLRPEVVAFYPHEVDHIRAEKHGGETTEDNLCLSCPHCNRHKGSDLTSVDPQTGAVVLLFNPRIDQWDDHFHLNGALIEGKTAIGRTTVRLLRFNDLEPLTLREGLIEIGRYP